MHTVRLVLQPSIRRVVDAAAAGDTGAFTELWRTHHPILLRYLTTLCGDPHRAEDIAAETWIASLHNLSGFRGRTHAQLRSWLITCARRTLIDATRRKDWHTTPSDQLPDRPGSDLTSQSALDNLSTTAALATIRTALSPDAAELVVLRYVADLDLSEIARLTGRSNGAVRVALHRALSTLREALTDPDGTACNTQER